MENLELGNELFKKEKRRRAKPKLKGEYSVQLLREKILELNEVLPSLDPLDKDSIKYLANLHSESIGLIQDITVYMIQHNYCGLNKRIDDSVVILHELIGLLKEFKELNLHRKVHGFFDETKATSFLKVLRTKMKELDEIQN